MDTLFNWTRTIYLYRGLPGSGKSTLALSLVGGNRRQLVENDDYWMIPSCSVDTVIDADRYNQNMPVYNADIPLSYQYERHMVHLAGWWCATEAFRRLRTYPVIAVANTFVQRKHIFDYVEEARHLGVRVQVHEATTSWAKDIEELFKRNVHNVPMDVLLRMQREWEEITQEEVDILLGAPHV